MKFVLLTLFVCLPAFAGKIGYKGSSLEVDTVGRVAKVVSVTSDNQNINVRKIGNVGLNSDDAAATNRTITLSKGEVRGQSLRLVLVSANPIELLDNTNITDAGSVKLSADWLPGRWDVLSLLWTGNHWIEQSRSDN